MLRLSLLITTLLFALVSQINALHMKRQASFPRCAGINCVDPSISAGVPTGQCPPSEPNFPCLCTQQIYVQSTLDCIARECNPEEARAGSIMLELECLRFGVEAFPPNITTSGATATNTRTIILPTETLTRTTNNGRRNMEIASTAVIIPAMILFSLL